MKKITEYLREKYGKWGWLGQRAHDAAGINNVLPLDFIVSCDYGADVPVYFREEDVFSIEKRNKIRKDWSNEHLKRSLQGAMGRDVFKKWGDCGKNINILCYRSLRKLEKDNRMLSARPFICAVPELLKRRFDNKVALCKKLPALSVSTIPCRVVQLGKVNFKELWKDLLLPFVIQFPYGSSGKFTFIIKGEKEFKDLSRKYIGQVVTAREYVNGFSINVNGIIVSGADGPKTFCSFPAIQIVGAPECSNFPTSFCGNDYASTRGINKDIIKKVEAAVKVMGLWMSEQGFRGIFGIDLVTDGENVYPIEINPRFQNSTSLYTVLESIQKPDMDPLFLLHIAEFLQDKDKVLRGYVEKFSYDGLMSPVSGSQVIIHNRMRRSSVTGKLTPGVYRFKKGKFEKAAEGASLTDVVAMEDILITCGVPKMLTIVEPNAPICKIQTLGPVLEQGSGKTLSESIKMAISCVYDGLKLKEADKAKVTV
ncbi:MAG: ATP-grasp domain-containing protein [Candidatus Omnitrophica bacterium]|nr:ATP-grasp domain-containing protein [Candidatus Omnitrophota bacterium]MBU1128464.1 ATP-grasp domain-containing protein [Candidatus Omnitrophota bacterium]MBU1784941.1 ATP-grasp domain-containing protein [Candidatus Omnitrophota bacterium]MBU1852048.1 ATP-grasp domain-containing protein [Candidatus Omnitrophota bacterium]